MTPPRNTRGSGAILYEEAKKKLLYLHLEPVTQSSTKDAVTHGLHEGKR
jgi:hypothetical protein